MPTAKLSSKAQIVIPAAIRRKLGLGPGDRLEMRVEGEEVIMRRLPASATNALKALRSRAWKGRAGALMKEREEWDG